MYLVVFTLLYVGAYLGWQATHGGVVSHHFLAQSSMPAISNWWGLVVLPLVAGLASWSVPRRAEPQAIRNAAIAGFAACIAGVALGVAFSIDKSGNAPLIVLLAVLVLALVFRTFRPEYVYGFVLGASVDFGLVLPAIIALVPATISAAVYFVVRPLLRRLRVVV